MSQENVEIVRKDQRTTRYEEHQDRAKTLEAAGLRD